MRSVLAVRLLAAALCTAATACLSPLSPNAPPLVRYFRPALPAPDGAAHGERGPLALQRVRAAPHLREPMVWRVSEVEYAFDEQNQWVEPPEVLVSEGLETVLYGEAGFRPDDGSGPTLEVHVEAFERSVDGAVVELALVLASGSEPPVRHRVQATHPIADDGPVALATAMGAALHDAAMQIAAFVAGDGEAPR
jgi:uncharacterized lipoprotein YmbA